MKKLLLLCTFLSLAITTSAQPAPPTRTTFAVEPSISDDNNSVCQIMTVWGPVDSPKIKMLANFAQDGGLEKIEVTLYRSNADAASFVYPRHGGEWAMELKANKENWISFAKGVRDQFSVISDNLYVETASYKLVAITAILDGFEGSPDMECLVLKNRFRTISVPLTRWVGRIPEEGESLHLGRDRTFGGALFAVEGMAYGGYAVDISTMDCLREYRKVRLAAK